MWKCRPNNPLPPKLAFGLWCFVVAIETLTKIPGPSLLSLSPSLRANTLDLKGSRIAQSSLRHTCEGQSRTRYFRWKETLYPLITILWAKGLEGIQRENELRPSQCLSLSASWLWMWSGTHCLRLLLPCLHCHDGLDIWTADQKSKQKIPFPLSCFVSIF